MILDSLPQTQGFPTKNTSGIDRGQYPGKIESIEKIRGKFMIWKDPENAVEIPDN